MSGTAGAISDGGTRGVICNRVRREWFVGEGRGVVEDTNPR